MRLVLGDQLNERHEWFRAPDDSIIVVMMEIMPETEYVTHHIQKLAAVFGAMRRFANRLAELGHRVFYIDIDDLKNRQSFVDNLSWIASQTGAATVEMQQPDEYRLDRLLDPTSVANTISGTVGRTVTAERVGSQHFLIERSEAESYLPSNRNPVMEHFYRRVRRKFGWLVDDDGNPTGGAWNHDAENRSAWKGPPRDPPAPPRYRANNDVGDERAAVDRAGCRHFGSIDPAHLPWPLNRAQALEALEHFVSTALPSFGTYEDAMHTEERSLFHSRLSFALNVKLISPIEVIESALRAWEAASGLDESIGVNDIEGFVRQVAGWREYMRILYWRSMPGLAEANELSADRPLPDWYWTGKTRMRCVSSVVTQSLEEAYAHHIQRLMVTGAFAMMAGIRPEEVDDWYLGIYIDAFDWVERPNTRGMSQHADGGVIATKPYAATARYIGKQSDYCAACAYDKRTRNENDSCPFNALYWHFYDRNRQLESNRRIGYVYPTLSRMGREELAAMRARGDWIRDHLEDL